MLAMTIQEKQNASLLYIGTVCFTFQSGRQSCSYIVGHEHSDVHGHILTALTFDITYNQALGLVYLVLSQS